MRTVSLGAAVLASVFVVASALCATPEASGARPGDVVSLRGETVSPLLGIPLENIGAFAVRNGALEEIPFQIDEVDGTGHLIYTTYDGGTTSERDGRLDGEDEVLFMARDAGERWRGHGLPKGAVGCEEIRITDPLGGRDSWAYILRFEGKAPRSGTDYVAYDPAKDWITARYYAVGFPYKKALQVPSYFSLSEAAGGDGKNIYDLYKIKLSIDIRFIGKIERSQNDFATVPVGYIDGPVRVSRRVKSALRLAGPLRSAMVYSDTHYYPYYCVFPALLQIPFKLKYVARSASVRVSDDFSPHAKGMVWYSDRNPGGVELTGRPAEAEKAMDRQGYRWKLITGPQGTMMNFLVFDPGLKDIQKSLYFSDDEALSDEPCQFRGQIGNSGYVLSDLREVPRGDYRMVGYVFCPVDFKEGDEEAYVNSVLHPLEVSAAPLAAGTRGEK